MSNDELFSDYDDDESVSEEKKTNSKESPKEELKDSNVKPSEVLAKQGSPYENLIDDQKIILGDMAKHYSLDVSDVITEFNTAYEDKTLTRWNTNLPKKFTLAKAMMKNVLDEKAKIKTFNITPIGMNIFYAKNPNMVISSIVALMEYEKNGKNVKKRKAIKGFDNVGEKTYKSLHKLVPFYSYEPMLIKDNKDEFTLSEFSSFEHGTQPEGKMANMTDLEIYEALGIKPQEDYKVAGMSKIPKNEKYATTDLKAVYVICDPVKSYKSPKDFDDVPTIYSKAMDFEGNAITINFPSLPEIETMINELPKDEKFTGVAIGLLGENEKTGVVRMNVYSFFPEGE